MKRRCPGPRKHKDRVEERLEVFLGRHDMLIKVVSEPTEFVCSELRTCGIVPRRAWKGKDGSFSFPYNRRSAMARLLPGVRWTTWVVDVLARLHYYTFRLAFQMTPKTGSGDISGRGQLRRSTTLTAVVLAGVGRAVLGILEEHPEVSTKSGYLTLGPQPERKLADRALDHTSISNHLTTYILSRPCLQYLRRTYVEYNHNHTIAGPPSAPTSCLLPLLALSNAERLYRKR